MFSVDYKKLRLSFNEFHNMEADDMPEVGEYCLLELKDGSYTGGGWWPKSTDGKEKILSGQFIRGTADTVDPGEVAKWHSLDRYDFSSSLEIAEVNWINLGVDGEDIYSVQFKDFKSLKDGDYPKKEQFCLLIFNNGCLGAGRWNPWRHEEGGTFIYSSALAQHSMDKVWAWTELSSDRRFAAAEEHERERQREAELNKNPYADPEKFKYGTDIEVYYEKALEKLREKYYWASLAQMEKESKWEVFPVHGKYVFAIVSRSFGDPSVFNEWTEGNTADEFIDFLCRYTERSVKNSNPEEKFKLGLEIGPYLEKAFENTKKEYRWLNKGIVEDCRYDIRKIKGDWEFVRIYDVASDECSLYDCSSAEDFIERVGRDYQDAALNANTVVAEYQPKFGHVDLHGWGLEIYRFSKLQSGDYKVYVQAGDRVTGGGREFFITPYCFEAKTYEEFLDRYLEIVPGNSFGMHKKDLLPDKELKKFLGY